MIIEIEEAKYKLNNFRADLKELGSALRIDELRSEVAELEKKALEPDFWNDQENSGKILRQTKQLKDKIERYEKLCAKLEDAVTLCELAIEENDESFKDEILKETADIEAEECCSPASTIITTRYFLSTRVQAAPKRRTGRRCSTVCTPAGAKATDIP